MAEREELNRLRNTWDDIAMPILRTLQEMEVEQGGNPFGADVSQIEERLGIDIAEVGPQLDSLEHDEFISVEGRDGASYRPFRQIGVKLLPKGRRALGEWPADPMETLAAALARRLEQASAAANNEERSRLKALAEKVRDAGPTIGLTLAVEALRAAFGNA
ncbi:MAG: hypothetical protein F4Y12_06550 [Acidimicrobiaceae bacterium]|nr:hypothetical protein [Acidimicrobiaceae bacterium]